MSPESIRAAGVILGSLTRANLDRLLAKGAQEVAACARRLAEQTARELDRAADERGVGSRGDIPVELVRRPAVTVLHLRSELLLVTAALQALAWALDPPSEPVIAY